MDLYKKNDKDIANIINGMKEARGEAFRLLQINKNQDIEAIAPFMRLILRGYNLLYGIYYEDVNMYWQATFFDYITKIILSKNKIITEEGICEGRTSKPTGTTCGLFCSLSYEKKVECSRRNILEIYFKVDTKKKEVADVGSTNIFNFLNISDNELMSVVEVEHDINLFNMLSNKNQKAIIKEQCYLWGCNIVEKIQSRVLKLSGYNFISDIELSCLVAEAQAFSQIYYYGDNAVEGNDDSKSVVKKCGISRFQLRYTSLLNDIELVRLLLPSSQNKEVNWYLARNIKTEKLIDRLKTTREICHDKRDDLYTRVSISLIIAYYFEYNLRYRYATNDVIYNSLISRKKKLKNYKTTIEGLYNEIINYEHKINGNLKKRYYSVLRDFRIIEKELGKTYIKSIRRTRDVFIEKFTDVDVAEYKKHTALNKISSGVHIFSITEIQKVKARWSV